MPVLKEIKAIHVADLEAALGRLGKAEAFRNGEMKCAVCGDTVVLDNAGCIKFTAGVPSLVCDKVQCYTAVMPLILGDDPKG